MKNSFVGTITDAGTNQQGVCRIVIETEESELQQLTVLPLFQATMVTIERIPLPDENADALGETMKMLEVNMPDGSRWRVDAGLIAEHRATHYANKEPGDDELMDWAANNMNWEDVRLHAELVGEAAAPDYQKGWVNGDMRIVIL